MKRPFLFRKVAKGYSRPASSRSHLLPLRLKKQEGCGLVAHESLTEPRVTIEWLLSKRNSLSDLPAFVGPYGKSKKINR